MHHKLDVYPLPRDRLFLYINEPWVIDRSIYWETGAAPNEPEDESDNVRVYMTVDLNANAIMRRLRYVIDSYKEATFDNEEGFIIGHSKEGVELIKKVIAELEEIPDIDSDIFPFYTIDELKKSTLIG